MTQATTQVLSYDNSDIGATSIHNLCMNSYKSFVTDTYNKQKQLK